MSGAIPSLRSPALAHDQSTSLVGPGGSYSVPPYSASPAISPAAPPIHDLWGITGHQTGLVTCTEISPSGTWLANASQDSTLLFVDFKAGLPIAILDLESHFDITALVWRSDSILVLGCSNGSIYQLTFDVTMKRPAAMRTLLRPFSSPIRVLAFDTISDSLAIACGGEVWIFLRTLRGQTESWDCVDQIAAPTTEAAGLVTALSFFRAESGRSHLFIGHAMAGWCIWNAPRSYHRTPYVGNGQACTIAAAAVALDGLFVAISTLESSIVIYEIKDNTLVLDSKREGIYQEASSYRPITPIAVAPNGLVMKGTIAGNIPMLDSSAGLLFSLHHGNNQAIRTLKTYGDYLVVGSSDGQSGAHPASSLKCYVIVNGTLKDTRRFNSTHHATVRIRLSHLLPFSERAALYYRIGVNGVGIISSLLTVGMLLVGLAILLDPPMRQASKPSSPEYGMVAYKPVEHTEFSQSKLNPTLTSLLRYGVGYALSRIGIWAWWIAQGGKTL
ncbi:putative transmembrane protein, partial [Rhizoctonia solani 123E]